jgi:hypothetical protein
MQVTSNWLILVEIEIRKLFKMPYSCTALAREKCGIDVQKKIHHRIYER